MAATNGTLNAVLEGGTADASAIVVPNGLQLSYSALSEQVERTADSLAGFGLGRGDTIAFVLSNSIETVVLFLAAATVGTAAPLNPAYKEEEFRFYLEDTGAKALVVRPGESEPARRALPQAAKLIEAAINERGAITLTGNGQSRRSASSPTPDDIALVLHTSGTTSRPKQVPLRHRNLNYSALNIARTYSLEPSDVALCVMPLFHIHGLMASTMATLSAGGTVVVPPKFDPMTFWQAAEAHRATWYSAVPTIHQMLLMRNRGERPAGATRLRFIRSSSSALSRATMRDLESRFGAPVVEAYGMTEASHQMASNPLPPRERRPGTVGVETGIEIAIMAEDDGAAILKPEQHGEVVIRGSSVIDGYAHNPDANKQAFTDGWFRTGDQGHISPDGYLSLVGRLKEMINRGGEKIAPREIDEVLLQHPAVGEAVAFGVPHERWGEEVAAAVVLKGDVSEKELLAFARERLADYKLPKRLFIVEQIPRTATGKIQRRAVATALADK